MFYCNNYSRTVVSAEKKDVFAFWSSDTSSGSGIKVLFSNGRGFEIGYSDRKIRDEDYTRMTKHFNREGM